MKNRNYLILAMLLTMIVGMFFIMLYATDGIYSAYWDAISLLIITIPLVSFYIIAFPDINQTSGLAINQYKMRWLRDLTILLGTSATFMGFLFMWAILREFNPSITQISNELSSSLAVAFLTMIYASGISFSFYIINIFLKDGTSNTKELGSRYISNTVSFLLVFLIHFFTLFHLERITEKNPISVLGFNDQSLYLLIIGILLFFNFQNNNSISMLIKNLFCDCKESADSIKSQIEAIKKTKRFIGALNMLAMVYFPTALFLSLHYYIDDSSKIFSLLVPGTRMMLWCYFIIIILTVLEGKYNYKLYQAEGRVENDSMFLPKYVALPTILYFMMVILLFILFNVLF